MIDSKKTVPYRNTDNSPKWNAARRLADDYGRERKRVARKGTIALVEFVFEVRSWNDSKMESDFENMERAGTLIKYALKKHNSERQG